MTKSLLQLLSHDEIETIHRTSLKVLEKIGVNIDNEEALNILHKAGVNVDFGKKSACIPEALVEECLRKAPAEFRLYSTDGKSSLLLGGANVYYNPGSTAVYMLDRENMQMRHPLSKDFVDFVRLTDGLEYIHAQSTAMLVTDVPSIVADRYRLYIILKNSLKPVVGGSFTIEGLHDMEKMLEIALGDQSALSKRPPFLMDVCPSPPLKWSKITSQNLIDSARYDMPLEIIPAPQLGSTAPVTLAGLLVQHNAEFLSGLVIAQLVKAGIPVVYSGSPSVMDMRYGTQCVGNIEVCMLSVAYSQIAKFYGIPSGAYLGMSETKTIDAQTGIESTNGIVLGTLAGINCITGPGMLAFENCQSFEKLVIDNEICGMALRLAKDIDVNEETLAFDLIEKVGQGGQFLSQKHTVKWFPIEEYIPSTVIDKMGKSQWEKTGARNTLERAKETVDRILKEHVSEPLPSDIERQLDSFMKEILSRAR